MQRRSISPFKHKLIVIKELVIIGIISSQDFQKTKPSVMYEAKKIGKKYMVYLKLYFSLTHKNKLLMVETNEIVPAVYTPKHIYELAKNTFEMVWNKRSKEFFFNKITNTRKY